MAQNDPHKNIHLVSYAQGHSLRLSFARAVVQRPLCGKRYNSSRMPLLIHPTSAYSANMKGNLSLEAVLWYIQCQKNKEKQGSGNHVVFSTQRYEQELFPTQELQCYNWQMGCLTKNALASLPACQVRAGSHFSHIWQIWVGTEKCWSSSRGENKQMLTWWGRGHAPFLSSNH